MKFNVVIHSVCLQRKFVFFISSSKLCSVFITIWWWSSQFTLSLFLWCCLSVCCTVFYMIQCRKRCKLFSCSDVLCFFSYTYNDVFPKNNKIIKKRTDKELVKMLLVVSLCICRGTLEEVSFVDCYWLHNNKFKFLFV